MKNYLKLLVVVAFSLSMIFSGTAMAQSGNGSQNVSGNGSETVSGNGNLSLQIQNPFKYGGQNGNLLDLLNAIVQQAVLPIGGVIVTIMMIYSGFLFVTASGNEEKIKTARKSFLYAAIGAAILLGAEALSLAVQNTIQQL